MATFSDEQVAAMAEKIVELAKSDLVARALYLAPAIGALELEPSDGMETFAVSGTILYFNPLVTIDRFRALKRPPTADVAHVLAHCLMLHPFVDAGIDKDDWNLSCDIVATRLAARLLPPWDTNARERSRALADIDLVAGPDAGAERIFACLRSGAFLGHDVVRWEKLFCVDDHKAWYEEERYGFAKNRRFTIQNDRHRSSHGDKQEAGAGEGDGSEETQTPPDVKHDTHSKTHAANRRKKRAPNPREQWEKTSYQVQLDLEAFSSSADGAAGSLAVELSRLKRRRVDYADFLRTFGTLEETMHPSEEEFDYVSYTYGLDLYGNVALVEPLEYRPEQRIREFVLAIDTSGSIKGTLMQDFVDLTCSLLEETDLFSTRLKLHVVQCDDKVQKVDIIESPEELKAWLDAPKDLYGFHETDFRPVFDYVDALRARGELRHLAGLLYFTDGKGVYPERKPSYKTAFAYFDPDGASHPHDDAPPWICQIALDANELDPKRRTKER